MMGQFTQPTYLGYLAILRIMVGYHFLTVAVPKFTGGNDLAPMLIRGAVNDPFDWHRAFILDFVVPHAQAFSYLTAYGELAIGLSLLFGFLVRLSGSFAAFYQINIYLAVAVATGGATLGLNRIFIALHLVFVAASAGRALGVDGVLKRYFPRSVLF
jgi:thiosulfate dehydrogenase [quinone] large subunit